MEHHDDAIIRPGSPESLANPEYAREPFTDFASVGPDTDLGALNLSWRERDLPERERTKHVHRLHPYLGKFVPQLVEIFLRKFRPRLVVDPFAGSGTTLVEAAVLGFDALGCDIAPFNCLLCKVKTDLYDLSVLRSEQRRMLQSTLRVAPNFSCQLALFGPPQESGKPRARIAEPGPYLAEWFHPAALHQLLDFLAQIPGTVYEDFWKVLVSRAARSARLTPHHELDFPKRPQVEPYYCHKHHRLCRPTRDATKFLVRYAYDGLRRVTEFMALRSTSRVSVVCADAREVDWPQCDLVVTSPPYLGLIDYHEQHRYAYELLSLLPAPFASVGYHGASPMAQQGREIGRPALGASARAQEAYLQAVGEVFVNLARRMVRGGHIVCVVNDRLRLYERLAAALGFKQVHLLRRHVNRRTGRRNGQFFEEVYVWRVC